MPGSFSYCHHQAACCISVLQRVHADVVSLLVAVPPGIVGENALEDVKVKEKHGVTLVCEVTGKRTVHDLPLLIKAMVRSLLVLHSLFLMGFQSTGILKSDLTVVLRAGLSTLVKVG